MQRILPFFLVLLLGCNGVLEGPQQQEPSGVIYVGYDSLEGLEAAQQLLSAELGTVLDSLGIAELRLPSAISADEALAVLAAFGQLRFAELPQSRERILPDANLGALSLQSQQWHLAAVRAPEAWQLAQGDGVVVAVIDSGVDGTHPALQDRTMTGYDAESRTPIPAGSDSSQSEPHGTHIAGLIAASGEVRGVAPGAVIMPVRVFAPQYLGDIKAAEGIVWAADNGAQVINASWGSNGYSQVLAEAITYALDRRVTIVAAAGNQGMDMPFYPAAYPGVIGVTALRPDGTPGRFSNRGSHLSLAAPGERLLSTVPGGYRFMSGTSMAAALVTGTVALLYEHHDRLWPYQIRQLLAKTAESKGLDALAALEAVPPARDTWGCLQVRLWTEENRTVPDADLRLRARDGVSYWARTTTQGVAGFMHIGSGSYELIVAAPSASIPNLRPEDRVVVERTVQVGLTCAVPLTLRLPL